MVQIRRFSHIQKMSPRELEQGIYNREIGANTWVRFDEQQEFQRLAQTEFYDNLLRSKKTRVYRRLLYPITPTAAFVIIGVLVRFYFVGWLPNMEKWFELHLLKSTTEIYELGELYRLFTYGLLHANFNHLLFNGVFVVYIAYHLSPLLGWRNLIFTFVICVFSGGFFSLCFSPTDLSLGSSGGVFGLGGVTVVMGIRHWKRFPSKTKKHFGWALLPYVAYGFFSGFYSPEVDNWCHIGGLTIGVLLGALFRPELSHPAKNYRIRLGGVASVVLCCLFLWWYRPLLIPLKAVENGHGLHFERPSLWLQAWLPWGEVGWFSPTQEACVSFATVSNLQPVDISSRLEAQLQSGGTSVRVTELPAGKIGGYEARRFAVQLNMFDENFIGIAVIVVRDNLEHRVLFLQQEDSDWAYEKLRERLFKNVHIIES